jgi:uncharacterized protein YjlB
MPATTPKTFLFKDDGSIPNSRYPLLIYQGMTSDTDASVEELEKKFQSNNWSNTWRGGLYSFHHYHSNTHEVLGVFSGEALLHMGGEKGEKIKVNTGDVLVIPAGVGHKCISHSDDFSVLGAYPNGIEPDLMKGKENERPQADKNIAETAMPETDPLFGKEQGLIKIWR